MCPNPVSEVTSAKAANLGETYMYKVYRGSGEGYTGGAVDIHAGPKDGMIRTKGRYGMGAGHD